MAAFVWSDQYRVDIREIDEQHQRLFQLASGLNDAMGSGKGKEVLFRVFNELIAYTRTHFATEDRLMDTLNLPSTRPNMKP